MATYKEYIKKNGKKSWKVDGYLGIDPRTGKQVLFKKRGFKSSKEAKRAYNRAVSEIEKNGFSSNEVRTFKQVYKVWLKTYKLTVKESSLVKLKQKFDNHILPFFGEMEIKKIKVSDVQQFTNEMCFEKKNTQYKEYVSNVSRIFEYAIKQGLVNKNPVKQIVIPKKKANLDDTKIHFYTMDQLKLFLKDAKANEGTQVYTVFHLLAYTGCRQGEILGLQWDCIDFDSKTLTVRQTLTRGENRRLYLEEPKTKKSKRTIPLDDLTISILKSWRTTQRKNMLQVGINTMDAKQLVFSNQDNSFVQITHPRLWMHRIAKRANLPILSPHALRHTFATMLISEGIDFKTVSELLGHSSVGMTLDTYAGVYEEQKTKTINLLAKMLN